MAASQALETSTFTLVPSSCTLTTLSAAEFSAVKQSVQACCAAASLKMSIGSVVWLLLPAAAINPLEPTRTLNYVVVRFGFIYISCYKSYPCHPIFYFFLFLNR
jgi:hypothetical protein